MSMATAPPEEAPAPSPSNWYQNPEALPAQKPQVRVWTEEEVNAERERIRDEEKSKLYGTISEQRTLLEQLKADADERKTTEEQARAAQEEEARRTEEAELSAVQLVQRKDEEWKRALAAKEAEWNSRLSEVEQARQNTEALFQKEREFADLKDYAQQAVAVHSQEIAPQLLPWIQGNTKDEIDSAIARAVQTTEAIAAEIQQTSPYPAPVTPGVRATSGPANSDPSDQYQTLTQEQIAGMDMGEYAKYRGRLGVNRSQQNKGMYG